MTIINNFIFYYCKSEAGVAGIHPSISCRMINSEKIAIFGGAGHISFARSPESGMIEVENFENIVVTHFRPWRQSEGWYTLKEEHGGETYGIEAIHKLALFKRREVNLDLE